MPCCTLRLPITFDDHGQSGAAGAVPEARARPRSRVLGACRTRSLSNQYSVISETVIRPDFTRPLITDQLITDYYSLLGSKRRQFHESPPKV